MTLTEEFRETVIWYLSSVLADYDQHDKFINTFIRIIDDNILSSTYVSSIVNNLMPIAMKNDDIVTQLKDFIDEVIEQAEEDEIYEVCQNLIIMKNEIDKFFNDYNIFLKECNKYYDRDKNRLMNL